MITNLVATFVITFTTNTTERFPGFVKQSPSPSDATMVYAVFQGEWVNSPNPDKKWVRTTIKRIESWDIDVFGKTVSVPTKEEIVSDTEVEFRLDRKWQQSGEPKTLPPGFRGSIFEGFGNYSVVTGTNVIFITNYSLYATNVSAGTLTNYDWKTTLEMKR